MDWPNLTEKNTKMLEDAIDQGEEYTMMMAIFQSGMIEKKYRWLQLSAHAMYDSFSNRQMQVFIMRIKQHSFPEIADALEMSVSSAKTYWRRSLVKCMRVIQSGNSENGLNYEKEKEVL
jgi:DNA-binding CsgD family transcriptional regulator